VANPNLLTRWSLPTLIASLSFMQTLLDRSLSVAREREQGTFDQLMVTPCARCRSSGKLLPAMTIGLIRPRWSCWDPVLVPDPDARLAGPALLLPDRSVPRRR
jgi:hypothetical protein